MRTLDVRVAALAFLALAATTLAVAGGGEGARTAAPRSGAAAWEGLVGEPRVDVPVGQRVLVVLEKASLADRVAAAGGVGSAQEQRRWTQRARTEQKLFVSAMNLQGADIRPEFSYTRVLNAFSAPLDPRTVALLERSPDVEGVYPVRAAYPASVATSVLERPAFAPGMGRRPELALPGFDGRGVSIALLDTGIDTAQPYLRGRVREGYDVVDGRAEVVARPRPDTGELERHGTELAGILVGANGPAGIAGVATGASIIPIRVAGWQRSARGEWSVFSRTDQILAGLERAVDPDDDGDSHDAARIALVGVAEPYAAFARGPLARATAGATALNTLVVAPAGNNGPAGPGFGKVAGPGGAPAALSVGAADLRERHERVRVVLRAGLNVVLDRRLPLAGAVAPDEPLQLRLATPRLAEPDAPPAEQAAALALPDFFDDAGFSRVAGRAALVPAGEQTATLVAAAARAGAEAAVVYGGALPAGALGFDERAPVPVVGVSAATGFTLLAALARGASAGASIGVAHTTANTGAPSVAPFSSRGLAFDGRVKPELLGPGVAIATSEPGATEDGAPRFGTITGSSAAAAAVAGAAALLAQARPDLDAEGLKSLLTGAGKPLGDVSVTSQGVGLVDVGAAAAAEFVAEPASLAFGRATKPKWRFGRLITLRNISSRTLRVRVRVEQRGFPAAEARVSVGRKRLILRPGESTRVRVEARVARPALGGPPAEGHVVLAPLAGTALRIPFAIAFGPKQLTLLRDVRLTPTSFEASDTAPALLSLEAGLVRTFGGTDELHPVERLDIELLTADGKRVGVIARQRNLLPGLFTFGITGRDPAGTRLEAGDYRLRIVALPVGGGPATIRSVPLTIT